MKISYGLAVIGLWAVAATGTAAELTTFQAGQVASASEVNGNFRRLAAEDEAIRADLEAAIEEGNAVLQEAITDGTAELEALRAQTDEANSSLQTAISEGAGQLEALQTQVSALLEEVDGLTARLAQVEGGSVGSGSTSSTPAAAFSPVGTWSYLVYESAAGFNPEGTSIFNAVYGENGVITFNADGTLESPNIAGFYGGVYTSVSKGADGLVLLNGNYEDNLEVPLGEDVFPIDGTWELVNKANGAVVSATIFDDDSGDRLEFSFDIFKGSADFMQAVLLDEQGEENNSKGVNVTSVSFFRVSE